jgi:hypothetical protein
VQDAAGGLTGDTGSKADAVSMLGSMSAVPILLGATFRTAILLPENIGTLAK